METKDIKELKIVAPDGYTIDYENSSFDCIKFKPIEKKLTYEDVADSLFAYKRTWYILEHGDIHLSAVLKNEEWRELNNCTSQKQAERLLAINKLMNVAKYLNGDWKPNWDNLSEPKYFLFIEGKEEIKVDKVYGYRCVNIYFKSPKLAEQAKEILGEDTVRLAFSTDW